MRHIIAETFTLHGASVTVRLLEGIPHSDRPICNVCLRECILAAIHITRQYPLLTVHQTYCAWHIPPQYETDVSATLDYLTHQQ